MEERSLISRVLDVNLALEERRQALNDFKASDDTMPPDILNDLLLVADGQLRLSALELCERQQDAVSTQVALALVQDSSPEIRRRAIPCLGRKDKQTGTIFLQEMALSDAEEEIRARAVQEIRNSEIRVAASSLLLRLQELVERHASTFPDQALPPPHRDYVSQLIGAQGDLGNIDAKSHLVGIAKAPQPALHGLRAPAIRALLDLGEAGASDIVAILDHHLGLWPGEGFAQEMLDQIRLYPRKCFVSQLLNVAAGVRSGPSEAAKNILKSDNWFSVALPVIASSLGRDDEKECCEAILEAWLTNEQRRGEVYFKLASQTGTARDRIGCFILRIYPERQLQEGSRAVSRVVALAVPYLGGTEEQLRAAEAALDVLLDGPANRPIVYSLLLDKANARKPLGERIEHFLLSRLGSKSYPQIDADLIGRISDVEKCGGQRAARYAQLLSRWGSQSYASDAMESNRASWLGSCAQLIKSKQQRVKHAGEQLLDAVLEVERQEFIGMPQDRMLAQHPTVRELWQWIVSGPKSLQQQADVLLERLAQDPHDDLCFPCFVLVSAIDDERGLVRRRALELLLKHEGLTTLYHNRLIKHYETETDTEARCKLIELMAKHKAEEFISVAQHAVLLTQRTSKERISLIAYLGIVEASSSLPILHTLLMDPQAEIRRATVHALEPIGDSTSIEPLNHAKREGSAPGSDVDSALAAIFLRHRHLLSAGEPIERRRGLELWRQVGIRVKPAMDDLAIVLESDGTFENRILAAQLYAIPGLGTEDDLPLLEKRYSGELESVKVEIKKAIMTIRGTRDFGLEKQLRAFEQYCEDENERRFLQVSYPILGDKTLVALAHQLDKFHHQTDPSTAILRLNNACEALTKCLFERFGLPVWKVDEYLLRRLLGRSKGGQQCDRLNWMEAQLADVDTSHFRLIDDLRRASDASHNDEEKREISPDELDDAKTEFVKALLWTMRACENPPQLKSKG